VQLSLKSTVASALFLLYLMPSVAKAQCTLTTSVNASTLTCGVAPLIACGGILYIGNGTNAMSLTMNSTLNLSCLGPIQVIIRNNATLVFTPGNDYLTLAEGSSISFLPGSTLTGGSCNASERIYIGTNLVASCNGEAGADIDFEDLITLGGTGRASATSPVCAGSTINLSATPPPNGTYTYSWSGPGLSATAYSSNPNYSVAATASGTYQVKMKSSLSATPAIAEIAVTVNSRPSTPTIGTITHPTCSVTTGSVVVSGLPASGTWTLARSGTSSGSTTGTGTSTTISGLAAGTYTFQCSNGTCSSLSSSNAVLAVPSTTWNGSNWSHGLPTALTNIIFNGNYSVAGNLIGCACNVSSGAVVISSGTTLKLTKGLTVSGGSITIDENASLVQVDDHAVNSGNIIVKRGTNIKKFDYVYWSAPVSNFSLSNLSPGTSSSFLYKWIPTIGGNYGGWSSANETMTAGKGYIVRGPDAFNNILAGRFTATFTGAPNNGVITATIQRGSYQGADYTASNGAVVTRRDDNLNLLGNPYPSSIKALDFLNLNPSLDGVIWLWTHGTLPSASAANPYYNSFAYNYTVSDYIVYNGTGTVSGPAGFNGLIASGQGFFVMMKDGAATTTTATFNNSLRNVNFDNTQFYKVANVTPDAHVAPLEGRIWVDLVSGQSVSRTLVGYVEGATNAKDRMFDAECKLDNHNNLYSVVDMQPQTIQGRALPFQYQDTVTLGFRAVTTGEYDIAIGAVDGIFGHENAPVYLKDNLLDQYHNLKQSPYHFTTFAGTFDDRFVLVYDMTGLDKAMSSNEPRIDITSGEAGLKILSEASITELAIYDLMGRTIFSRDQMNQKNLEVDGLIIQGQVIILKIKLADGRTVIKKVNY
jgi:hypothetical protein